MFVCTVKASSLKFFAAILLSAAVLVGIVAWIPVLDSEGEVAVAAVQYKGIRSVEEQLSFLSELGYTVDPKPVTAEEIVIPEEFDSVYQSYNELQKEQGLNLEKYRGKSAMRYTYALVGDEQKGQYATLLIYKNRIIGGDITTTSDGGSVERLVR